MANYIKKPEVVDVIEFVYTAEGIAALQEFCPGINVFKDRHPSARAGSMNPTAFEGDFILKDEYGGLRVCSPNFFRANYDEAVEILLTKTSTPVVFNSES